MRKRISVFKRPALLTSAAILATALVACDAINPTSQNSSESAPIEARTSPTDAVPASATSHQAYKWTWSSDSLGGWSFGNDIPETYWHANGGLGLKAPDTPEYPDVFIRSPKLDIPGKNYTKLLVDLECIVAAARNDLTVYYTTEGHGESTEYKVQARNGQALAAGERKLLVYDTTRLKNGGDDWVQNTIRRIRFDLPQGANSEYVVHSIRLCHPESPDCR